LSSIAKSVKLDAVVTSNGMALIQREREASMPELAKTLPEHLELTESEITALAGGPPTEITPSSGIVSIEPNLVGADFGVVFEAKKKTVTQPFLTITIKETFITSSDTCDSSDSTGNTVDVTALDPLRVETYASDPFLLI